MKLIKIDPVIIDRAKNKEKAKSKEKACHWIHDKAKKEASISGRDLASIMVEMITLEYLTDNSVNTTILDNYKLGDNLNFFHRSKINFDVKIENNVVEYNDILIISRSVNLKDGADIKITTSDDGGTGIPLVYLAINDREKGETIIEAYNRLILLPVARYLIERDNGYKEHINNVIRKGMPMYKKIDVIIKSRPFAILQELGLDPMNILNIDTEDK